MLETAYSIVRAVQAAVLPLVALWSGLLALRHWRRRRANMVLHGEKIPGPGAWPFLGNALEFEPTGPGVAGRCLELFKTYGQLFRLWLGPVLHVTTSDYRDHEAILSGSRHMSKGLFYKFLHPWLGQGLVTASGERWREHRRIIAPMFHYNVIDQFVRLFNSYSDTFVRQLGARAEGPSFDVCPLVKLFTLDVIFDSTLGVKVNAQLDSKSEYVSAMTSYANILVQRVLTPWLHPDFIFRFSDLGRKHEAALKVLLDTTDGVIRERKQELDQMQSDGSPLTPDELGRKKRVAFLDLLLLSQRAGADLSDTDIREEVNTLLATGHDPAASALAFTLFLLSRDAAVQEKIMAELGNMFERGKTIQLTAENINQLQYVEMVVKESLRLYPPAPFILRVIDRDQRLASCNRVAPEGSSIILPFYFMHRDPYSFPDPEKFDPERFRPEKCLNRDPFAYLPFSAGPRNCIGQKFAMMELKCVVAKVIWSFKIHKDPDYEPVLSYEMILESDNGVRIMLEPRE